MPHHADLLRSHHLFDLKYRLGDLRGSSVDGSVLLRPGEQPLLITAPHSVTQVRAGKPKAAEFWTGALAESLARLTGATALTALSPRIEAENAGSADAFTDVLDALLTSRKIGLVVDIHGLSGRHGVDVNIGIAGAGHTGQMATFEADLATTFSVAVGDPYDGSKGITGLVNRSAGWPAVAVQLELGPRLRNDTTAAADIQRLADAISALVEALDDTS